MITCIGCIKLLTYLASKYLNVGAHHQNSTMTLSNISLYIYGNLTNHCMAMNFFYQCSCVYIHRSLYFTYLTLFSAAVNFDIRLRSVGMMAITWCFATFVFVNIYSSCMSSYMALQFQRPDIATFQDLANNPYYQPTTVKGVTAEFIFLVISKCISK